MDIIAAVLILMTLVYLFCQNNKNIWLSKIHEDLQELIKVLKGK